MNKVYFIILMGLFIFGNNLIADPSCNDFAATKLGQKSSAECSKEVKDKCGKMTYPASKKCGDVIIKKHLGECLSEDYKKVEKKIDDLRWVCVYASKTNSKWNEYQKRYMDEKISDYSIKVYDKYGKCLKGREIKECKDANQYYDSVCLKDEYKNEYKKLSSYYRDYCNGSHIDYFAFEDKSKQGSSISNWREKQEFLNKTVLPTLDKVEKTWLKCFKEEQDYVKLSKYCRKADGIFNEVYVKYLSDFKTNMKTSLGQIKYYEKGKMYGMIISTLDRLVKDLGVMSEIFPKEKQFLKDKKILNKKKIKFEKIVNAKLAKIRCPKKNKNPKLSRQLHKIFQVWLSQYAKNTGFKKKTAKTFRIEGKVKKTYDRYNKITHQTVPASVCMETISKDDKVDCAIFGVTMKRSKPDSKKWGEWKYYSIGHRGKILCKKAK